MMNRANQLDYKSFISGIIYNLVVVCNLDIENKEEVILGILGTAQLDLGSILDTISSDELLVLSEYISKYFNLDNSDSKLIFLLAKDCYSIEKLKNKKTQTYYIAGGEYGIEISNEQIKRYLPFLKIENLI